VTGRVTLLTTNLARGGAETQVARLAAGLRARGWDASVVSLLPPSAWRQELESAHVPVFSLDLRPGRVNLLGLGRLARILRLLRPQVLHAHMFHANVAARVARLVCPVPVVISTIHSFHETSRRSDDSTLRDALYRATNFLSDVTTAVCRAAAERHVSVGAVSHGKMRVIHNGVDTREFRPDAARRAEMRTRLGLSSEFVWLAAGRLMWKKDYPTLLRACARLKDCLLLVAGQGPQEEELRRLAGEPGANARFLGLQGDMPSLLNACDGFVLSSLVEGLPLALLEAASSGVPCVATAVGGVPEIVLDQTTGLVVPPGDPVTLAQAMARLMDMDAASRRSMGEAARAHVLAYFDLNVVTSRWESLYREYLGFAAGNWWAFR